MGDNQQREAAEVSPFLAKAVACPLCELVSPQRRIKRHLYQEQKRDIDLKPLSYHWKGKGLTVQHPLIHFLWHCPGCRFTAWPGAWENPIRGTGLTLTKYRAALRDLPGQDPADAKVRALLLQGWTWPELDYEQGLRLHLLAVHQLLLLKKATGALDSLNLGRYCLRLAWLFRELGERPELSPTATRMAQLAGRLRPLWPEAPLDDAGALRAAAGFYEIGATDAQAVEDVGELCNLLLLITRIHLKLRQFDPAKRYLGRAHELTRNLEQRKQQMEGAYYQLEQRARSEARAVSELARKRQQEVSAQIVELDSKFRGMRFKVQDVRELLQDEMDAPPPGRTAATQVSDAQAPDEDFLDLDLSLKPKKKRLRDLFK